MSHRQASPNSYLSVQITHIWYIIDSYSYYRPLGVLHLLSLTVGDAGIIAHWV